MHDSDSKDPGSIPDSVKLGPGPGRNGAWDDPTLSLACPNYGSGRFIRKLSYELNLTHFGSVTQRGRRDRFRDRREVGQLVSADRETDANRFLSLRSVDFHYFHASWRQLWTPQFFPSERDRA